MVYTNTFVVDLSSMQSVKQLTVGLSIYGMYKLFVRLPVRAVRDSRDDFQSQGCTWKKIFDLLSFLSHSPGVMPPTQLLPSAAALLSASSHCPLHCRPSWSYQSRLPDPSDLPVQFSPSLSLSPMDPRSAAPPP
jgi:hypothetical protein